MSDFEYVRGLLTDELSKQVGIAFSSRLVKEKAKSDKTLEIMQAMFGGLKENENEKIEELVQAINLLAPKGTADGGDV